MAVSSARSRARRSQLGLTTPVLWEKRAGTAPVNGDRCATKFHRISSCEGRGTGPDRGGVSFHLAGRAMTLRDSWRYPLWLSAFTYGSEAFRPAIRRVQDSKQNGTFLGSNSPISSHFFPSTPAYLERAKHASRGQPRNAGAGIVRGGTDLKNGEPVGVGHNFERRRGGLGWTMALPSPAARSQTVASPVPQFTRPRCVCVRSLNPCGQRTRDEHTKRTSRLHRRRNARVFAWYAAERIRERCDAENRNEGRTRRVPAHRQHRSAVVTLKPGPLMRVLPGVRISKVEASGPNIPSSRHNFSHQRNLYPKSAVFRIFHRHALSTSRVVAYDDKTPLPIIPSSHLNPMVVRT